MIFLYMAFLLERQRRLPLFSLPCPFHPAPRGVALIRIKVVRSGQTSGFMRGNGSLCLSLQCSMLQKRRKRAASRLGPSRLGPRNG
jgi:hypothetical protein